MSCVSHLHPKLDDKTRMMSLPRSKTFDDMHTVHTVYHNVTVRLTDTTDQYAGVTWRTLTGCRN